MNNLINLNKLNLSEAEKQNINLILTTEGILQDKRIKDYQNKVIIVRIAQLIIIVGGIYIIYKSLRGNLSINSLVYINPSLIAMIFFGVIISTIIIGFIPSWFRRNVDLQSLKQELVNKLLTRVGEYSGLGIKFSNSNEHFTDSLRSLSNEIGIINDFDSKVTDGDSIEINNGDFIIQGKEIETTETTRDSDGKRSTKTTNHCYLYKISYKNINTITTEFSISKDKFTTNWGILKNNLGGFLAINGFLIGISLIFSEISGYKYETNFITLIVMSLIISGIISIYAYKLDKTNSLITNNNEFEKYFDIEILDENNKADLLNNFNNDFLNSILEFNIKRKYKIYFYDKNLYINKDFQRIFWNGHNLFELTSPKSLIKDIIELYIDIRDINIFAEKISRSINAK